MSAVATMPVLSQEQLDAIKAQVLADHKAQRKARKAEKPSSLASQDIKAVHALEQSQASERDKLIDDGHKLCGIGLTNERVAWANRSFSYARSQADSKGGMIKILDQLQVSIHHKGDDVSSETTGSLGKIRTINESFQLACVAHFVPQVKLLDWGCAIMFIRFLNGFNPASPEITNHDECKEIASAVALSKKEYTNKNGYIDRKKVKEAIDAILGKRASSKKEQGEGETEGETEEKPAGVTSTEAVANWFKQAGETDIAKLMALLGAQLSTNVTETMIAHMPADATE